MITITPTENLTGVHIEGSSDDFHALVDSFYALAIDEHDEKNEQYIDMSTRVLALCYDIRHAFMGDREIYLRENNMNEDIMRAHNIITPTHNVSFGCYYLYPEMAYNMMAVSELIELRARKLSKRGYAFSDDYRVVWDEPIAHVRMLQASFAGCMKEVMSPNSYMRWLKLVNDSCSGIAYMTMQYLDMLNIKYLGLSKEKRQKGLYTYARRIAEHRSDDDCIAICEAVDEGAREYGVPPSEIRLQNIDYPEEIIW